MLAALDLRSCGDAHVFIDGGSNLGESVDAFYGGAMHRCALHSPNRLYGDSWQSASAAQRAERVASLATPKLWCVRSFEANPRLLPALHEREKSQRADKLNVRYIDGLLGTTTSKHGRSSLTAANRADPAQQSSIGGRCILRGCHPTWPKRTWSAPPTMCVM